MQVRHRHAILVYLPSPFLALELAEAAASGRICPGG
jgi:hypothetical protein